MKKYLVKYEAIIDMHERGYSEDFHLVGNRLLWLQGKEMVETGDFSIEEYHLFYDSSLINTTLIILGVVDLYHGIKGILMNHCKNYPFKLAPVIRKKLDEISVYALEEKFIKVININ